MMDEFFAAFQMMIVSICCLIWFRQISHFFAKVNIVTLMFFPFLKKWITYKGLRRYYEIISLILGGLFLIISLIYFYAYFFKF